MKMSFHLLEFICAVRDLIWKSTEKNETNKKKVVFFSQNIKQIMMKWL